LKISIITVALISAEYIADCIKSVISQDYTKYYELDLLGIIPSKLSKNSYFVF
jgi:GT2 family glycosyltransferase